MTENENFYKFNEQTLEKQARKIKNHSKYFIKVNKPEQFSFVDEQAVVSQIPLTGELST